jgi:hypothetical protein
MKTLMTGSVYDLSAEEKLKILTALCGQLMTYATSREYIEDGFDKYVKSIKAIVVEKVYIHEYS